jgi:type I restriction enzyme, S subunit
MKLLSLLKELSLHPKNAEELKGLILQLAIQGKLTAKWRKENPSVEHASTLLKRIEAEKQQLITEKKIRKENPPSTIKKEETLFNLPEKWIWSRGGEILNFEQGIQVDKNSQTTEKQNGSVRFLRIVDFTQQNAEVRYIKNPGHKYYISEDNLVMVRYGTVGHIGSNKSGVLANNLFKIHYHFLQKEYCIYYFKSPLFLQALKENTIGSIMPSISFKFMKANLIPIPPLEEQKAIVEVVNQLFREVEQLEELTKERISLKEDFVTSALRRLTETDNTTQEWNYLKQHFSSFR